jgi:integrase
MKYRKLTKYKGVYERQSISRTHKGKTDFCFDIAYRSEGKLVWEKVGWLSEGYSAKLASQVRSDRIRSIRHGEELPKQKNQAPLFKDVAKKYLAWAKENKKSWFSDEHRYNNHLAKRFDNKKLNEISTFDLEKAKSELLKEKLAPATVKHVLVLFRQMFNKAIAWDIYKGMNPIKGVKLPILQNQKERFLSYEEAQELLNTLAETDRQLHDMALISLHTGIRAGEIFNLKGQDMNFTHDFISILDSKNTRPRNVYMTDAVKEILLKYNLLPDEYIFKNSKGEKYLEIPKTFKVIADNLFNKNIKDTRQRITFHSLRHTFGSWLALQGESLLTIRELLGHKSFTMTQRYAHLIPDERKRATLALEKTFNMKQEKQKNLNQ